MMIGKVSSFFFNSSASKIFSVLIGGMFLAACDASVDSMPSADIVFKNAKVYTVDKDNPWATSVAISGGKILAVGSDADTDKWRGDKTEVIDLGGKLVLPSFGDAHVHPVYGGLAYARCSMHAAETVDAYTDIIKKCVDETDTDRWVYGVGWRPGLFPPDGIPPKGLLDEISSDRPLVFRSTGGHSLWVNSKALELAGITKDTPDPLNGRIDRDPVTGELLGGLQETAKDLVAAYLPGPTQQDLMKAITYTINHLNTIGITNILDAGVEVNADGVSPIVEAYKALQAEDALTADIEVAVKWNNEAGMEQIPDLMAVAKSVAGPNIASHTLKIWIDGVIAQRTAALLEPYSDAHGEHGEPTLKPDVLNEVVKQFDEQGFQVMIHAIGDKGIRMSLDAFEYARKHNGVTKNHHQITHAEFITPQDMARFAELGVLANFQPLWSTMDPYMQLTAVRVGPERMKHVYPAHSVLQAGGEMVYGSDWSVAPAEPFMGIEVALTRRALGDPDAQPLLPNEAVTLEQAIEAYTLTVARVNHRENETGSLTVGKNADLVVVDQDVFTIPVYDIGKTKILLTMFEGKPLYGNLEGL
ncbi:amidohydrolase [Kordiimonas pumila]|uniref:Amidohydrolase n=1 Tax=Kordiimonas pumila TaxID=2161677 RepID=A0ABV7D6M5_9PROT|nr:amidohydrolase [Kordiimonas pumila]